MNTNVRILSGFVAMYRSVQEYFEQAGGDTVVLFGYRARNAQKQAPAGANRVVFLPGDLTGNGGKIAPARDVGRRELEDDDHNLVALIRPLASWERQFTISIWGVDASNLRDELLQAAATEALFERTLRAVESFPGTGGMNVAWGNVGWTLPKENSFGTELLVGLAIAHPLMDAPEEVGRPGFTLQRTGT